MWWTSQCSGYYALNPTDGDLRTFELPDWVTSVSTRAQGGLVLSMRKTFAFYEPETGDLEILADPEPDRSGNRFNDGKCDRQGRLWAGTMGAEDWLAPTGALYRFDPDRRITRMHDEIKCSNGIGWSPDGRVMYHTESFRYAIFAFDFDPDSGEIGGRRPFVQLDPEGGGFPDGLTVDGEGFVWSAQPVYGRIVRYDPDGEIDRIVDLPVSRGTGVRVRRPGHGNPVHHERDRDADRGRDRRGAARRQRVRDARRAFEASPRRRSPAEGLIDLTTYDV